jgi:hypothetical protein
MTSGKREHNERSSERGENYLMEAGLEQNRADSPGRIRNDRVLAVPVAARREVAIQPARG